MSIITDWKRFFYLKKWQKSVDALKQANAEAFYRVWEMGYFAGKLGVKPDKAWEDVSKLVGIEYPLSPRLKGGSDEQGKSG